MEQLPEENFDWAIHYAHGAPRYLYIYRPIDDHLRDTLLSGHLFLADPFSFNDPFDCQLSVDFTGPPAAVRKLTEQFLKNAASRITDSAKLKRITDSALASADRGELHGLEKHEENFLNNMRSSGIVCFSEVSRDILMWSHYAAKHKGVCLQFDTSVERNWMNAVKAIYYSREYPTWNFITQNSEELMSKFILTKSQMWRHEKEWRFFYAKPTPSRLITFPSESLRSISFGCQCDPNRVNEIKLLVSGQMPHVKLMRARQSRTRFELGIFPLGWME